MAVLLGRLVYCPRCGELCEVTTRTRRYVMPGNPEPRLYVTPICSGCGERVEEAS